MRIGVLALQGGFRPHLAALAAVGHEPIEVRDRDALDRSEGLILCGGESTAQAKLIARAGLEPALHDALASRPVLATCAGLILLARYELLDVSVERNAYGAQIESFETTSDGGRPLIFIRAPRIRRAGPRVETLDTLAGEPIMVRQAGMTAATFHPELTGDRSVYALVFPR